MAIVGDIFVASEGSTIYRCIRKPSKQGGTPPVWLKGLSPREKSRSAEALRASTISASTPAILTALVKA
jgi:hypothetical protein